MFDNEKRLQAEVDTFSKKNVDLEREKEVLQHKYDKLRENLDFLTASNEQEVQLRL